MKILYQIKKTDGTWNSTESIAWTNYAGSQTDIRSIVNGTLLTANIPNVNSNNVPYYPFKVSDRNKTVYFYNDATNSWEALGVNEKRAITSTKGMKFVIIPSDANSFKIYVCRNNSDYSLVPNIAATMRLETYVSDDITKDTFSLYRQWNHNGSAYGDACVPLAIFGICQYDSSASTKYFVQLGVKLKQESDGSQNLVLDTGNVIVGYESDPATDDGLLPTIQNYYYSASEAPSPVDELEVRVTKLENELSDLITRVTALEKQIKDIPELIAWTNEAVSKHYVAR